MADGPVGSRLYRIKTEISRSMLKPGPSWQRLDHSRGGDMAEKAEEQADQAEHAEKIEQAELAEEAEQAAINRAGWNGRRSPIEGTG